MDPRARRRRSGGAVNDYSPPGRYPGAVPSAMLYSLGNRNRWRTRSSSERRSSGRLIFASSAGYEMFRCMRAGAAHPCRDACQLIMGEIANSRVATSIDLDLRSHPGGSSSLRLARLPRRGGRSRKASSLLAFLLSWSKRWAFKFVSSHGASSRSRARGRLDFGFCSTLVRPQRAGYHADGFYMWTSICKVRLRAFSSVGSFSRNHHQCERG